MFEQLKLQDREGVRLIMLARPEKKNAFSVTMGLELWRALEEADADPQVRVIAVSDTGDYFSGGVDVNVFVNLGSVDPRDLAKLAHLYQPLRACRKPTIAIVQGHAVGMGVTMLPHFDLVYAAEHATFMTPFVKLGLVLEYGSAHTLSRLIGLARAKELILRAAPIDARTALEWGLVTRLVSREHAIEEALAIAIEIAKHPPGAIAECKRLLNLGVEETLANTFDAEEKSLASRYGSPENVEAVMAFLNRKRG